MVLERGGAEAIEVQGERSEAEVYAQSYFAAGVRVETGGPANALRRSVPGGAWGGWMAPASKNCTNIFDADIFWPTSAGVRAASW